MNVGELRIMLDKYPNNMDVLNIRCSDYELVLEEDWSVVDAVPQGFYWMRAHPTMSDENKKRELKCLLLAGN